MNKDERDKTMRKQMKWLGILCMLLVPVTLLIGLMGWNYNTEGWWRSISANFYTNAKLPMIIGIGAMAILFFSYEGYDKTDKRITNIAGIAGLLILAFPCSWEGAMQNQITLPFVGLTISHIIHCISALTLFGTFAVMTGFRFTKHRGIMTIKKMRRNIVYYTSAVVIAIFMILQLITSIADLGWFTIVNEFFMLEAFGFSFLVKGGCIPFFNDKTLESFDLY